jgi:hypothetical protein
MAREKPEVKESHYKPLRLTLYLNNGASRCVQARVDIEQREGIQTGK